MIRFYLLPMIVIAGVRAPAYVMSDLTPDGIVTPWAAMDYGFAPTALLVAKDISQEDHDWLVAQPDVFAFPVDLTEPVSQTVQPFFEGVNLPTDWMTPATTYQELMRQTAGMFQFNQRYMGIAASLTGELHSIFDNATLDTRLRQLTEDEQLWFLLTVESFGFNPALINDNAQLRLLVKQAADYWADQTFYLGGIAF
jgi:hypothetical protein